MKILNWTGLLVNGSVAFILPLVLAYKTVDVRHYFLQRRREEARDQSVSIELPDRKAAEMSLDGFDGDGEDNGSDFVLSDDSVGSEGREHEASGDQESLTPLDAEGARIGPFAPSPASSLAASPQLLSHSQRRRRSRSSDRRLLGAITTRYVLSTPSLSPSGTSRQLAGGTYQRVEEEKMASGEALGIADRPLISYVVDGSRRGAGDGDRDGKEEDPQEVPFGGTVRPLPGFLAHPAAYKQLILFVVLIYSVIFTTTIVLDVVDHIKPDEADWVE